MNRQQELKVLLSKALDFPRGLILKVTGGQTSQRQTALAALAAAKRDLLPDEPAIINVQIKPVPGREDEIALIRQPEEAPDDT